MNKYLIQDGEEIKKYVGEVSYTENLVPIMTSNTEPGGIVSASSVYGTLSSRQAWNAFASNDSRWFCNENVGWISYKFSSLKQIESYTIKGTSSTNIGNNPGDWTLEGYDGSSWLELDSQNGIVWSQNEIKEFIFSNNSSYMEYRINVTGLSVGTNSNRVEINEIEFKEKLPSGWQVVALAPPNKEVFDVGMIDVSVLTTEILQQLKSVSPELLCWTDEAEPARHVTQDLEDGWYPISDTLPTEELFLSEGMDNLLDIPSTGWDMLPGEFDVVSYGAYLTSDPAAALNATPHGQLVFAETDFSGLQDLTVTAAGEGVRLLTSGDAGQTWQTFTTEWTPVAATAAAAAEQGMTPAAFNELTDTEWKQLGSSVRLAYYVEEADTVNSIGVRGEDVAIETPSLDSVTISYDELTIEGRLKDLEKQNAINFSKLQFKTNTLMGAEKYKLHDLVVDTFETDSMILVESAGEEVVQKAFTEPIPMEDGFYSEVSLEEFKNIKGVSL